MDPVSTALPRPRQPAHDPRGHRARAADPRLRDRCTGRRSSGSRAATAASPLVRAGRAGRAEPCRATPRPAVVRRLRRHLGDAARRPRAGRDRARRLPRRQPVTRDEVPLQLTSARYVAMQAHFDTDRPGRPPDDALHRLDPGLPGLVAGRGRARAVAGAQPGRAVPRRRVRAIYRPGLAARHLARGRPRPHRVRRPAAARRRPGRGVRRLRRGAPHRSPGPTSTSRRCSRRCGRAVATSRSASSTSSPRIGSRRWSGRCSAADVRRRGAAPGPRRARARAPRLAELWRAAAEGDLAGPGTSRGMKTLFVTDPLAGLSADIDASVGLMDACQTEGAEVWVCEPSDLAVADGRLVARARRIELRPAAPRRRPPVGGAAELVRRASSDATLDVAAACEVVWLRIDPPVDARYLHTTYLLDLAAAAGVRVVNHPTGVRALHEKLLALHLPELCPATLVTSRAVEVEAFVARTAPRSSSRSTGSPAPTSGCSSRAAAAAHSPSRRPRRRSARDRAGVPALGGGRQQAALPGRRRDRRRGAAATLGRRLPDRAAVSRRRRSTPPTCGSPRRSRRGWWRTASRSPALDVIDGRLIEVNVTCPGGMHKTDALLGTDLSGVIVRRLLPTLTRTTERNCLS